MTLNSDDSHEQGEEEGLEMKESPGLHQHNQTLRSSESEPRMQITRA